MRLKEKVALITGAGSGIAGRGAGLDSRTAGAGAGAGATAGEEGDVDGFPIDGAGGSTEGGRWRECQRKAAEARTSRAAAAESVAAIQGRRGFGAMASREGSRRAGGSAA